MNKITELFRVIEESRITVIASYSGNRYTYGELKTILSIAEQSNVPVGFISLIELNASSLKNLISVYSGVDFEKWKDGLLNTQEFEKLVHTSEVFYHSNLLFDVLRKDTTDECIDKIKALNETNGTKIIFLDYFEELSVELLKKFSLELNISIVLLVHKNVTSSKEKFHFYDLSLLQNIEIYTDCIIFNKGKKEIKEADLIAELAVVKNRNGPIATYHFDG